MVSIIIPVKNEGPHILNTVRSIQQAFNQFPYEIIVIDHNSTDGCCDPLISYAEKKILRLLTTPLDYLTPPRNLGAAKAHGDILLFCDAHLLVPAYWIDQLIQPILSGQADAVAPAIAPHNAPQQLGYGQTWDQNLEIRWLPAPQTIQPVPLLPGGCFAVKKEVFQQVQGFDAGFRGWGYEDQEISLNLWLQGYQLCVQPQVKVLHVFRKSFPYPVEASNVYYNLLRLAYTHFNPNRQNKTAHLVQKRFPAWRELQRQAHQEAESRRAYLQNHRVHDDDWFMQRFNVNF